MARPAFSRNHTLRLRKGADARSRLWQAMRILREFDAGDLMAVCELTQRRPVLNFCSELVRAGYLARHWKHNNQPARYWLLRNTGPEAPAYVRKRSSLWDLNTGEEFPLEPPGNFRA